MRSKANFRGHPIHPALIPFPVAFLAGAFVFDLLGVWLNAPALWSTGAHLAVAGVLTGLLAAAPGLIDLVYTLPPRSSGRNRGIKHMLLMLGTVALFAVARYLRNGSADAPGVESLALEALGALLLGIGGWMGGTLVSRNQASVDMRYANAGKWQEERVEMADGAIVVEPGKLGVDQMRLLRIAGRSQRLVLARTETGYVAFDDHCPHKGGTLAGGAMICGTVQCPWHGSQFDVTSGALKAGPATTGIATYTVRANGRTLRIEGVLKERAAAR